MRSLADRPRPLEIGRVLACIAVALLAALALVWWSPAHAEDTDARVPESPYFHVHSDDPGVDALPLKATQVDVRIAGVIAAVTVTQHYRNEGQRPIEARYVFPGSTQAAVHAMTVRVGEREIVAQIREKQRARLEYDNAKREGKTTALLEQERPNVFSMNVANILPGDDVRVELQYTELIAPHDGRYRYVFPTVVGPRYRSPAASPANGSFPATRASAAGRSLQRVVRSGRQAARAAADPRGALRQPQARSAGPGQPAGAARAGRRRPARQPRLHPRIQPRRRAHRHRADAVPGAGRARRGELLSRAGRAAESGGTGADQSARLHLRGRHLGLHARLPAGHREGAAAPPDRRLAAERQLQRGAVLRLEPRAVGAIGAGDTGQHRARVAHHRPHQRRRQHRDRAGVAPRGRAGEAGRRVAQRDRGHRRLRGGRERGVPAGAAQPRPVQRLRVRHRQLGQPPPDRRPGTRRPGRGVRRHQARARRRAGRTPAPHDRHAGAHATEGPLHRPRGVRRRARCAARRDGWPPGGGVGQVARRSERRQAGVAGARGRRQPQRRDRCADPRRRRGGAEAPVGAPAHRAARRRRGARRRAVAARTHHRARPEVRAADQLHQFHRGRSGGAHAAGGDPGESAAAVAAGRVGAGGGRSRSRWPPSCRAHPSRAGRSRSP